MKNYLKAQTTTIILDGAAPSTSATLTARSRHVPIKGISYPVFVNDTGVTLSAGESLQVNGMVAVSNVVPDAMLDEITHRPILFRPERPLTINCRITASA